ncbi:MAG: type IV pilus assembly protein PilM [Candidatus Vogelbacteria bacterium]|nr:type IV pilus assembly protein PilM [Candidatus Vogelbacteria bacterium]
MANIFKSLMDSFKLGLFKKKDDSVVGIDIGSSSIKAVQIRRDKGQAILETYGELALGPYKNVEIGRSAILTPEKLVEALNDLFREANITTKRAAIAIPFKSSLISLIELPSLDRSKVDEMIPIEARKYIPVPMSEVLLDWSIIPRKERELGDEPGTFEEPAYTKKKVETVEVLVVAIHKNILEDYKVVVDKMGLSVGPFEIETFSAIRSVFGHDLSATAIIDIGSGSTRVIMVDYGIARVAHTINKGSQDITIALSKSLGMDFSKAEEVKRSVGAVGKVEGGDLLNIINPTVEFILFEASRIILGYQKKYARSIGKVILIGGGSMLRGMVDIAAKNLELEVKLGDPFKRVEAPAFLDPVLKEAGPSFAVAIGVALRDL